MAAIRHAPIQTARLARLGPALDPAQQVARRDRLAPDQNDRNDVCPEQPGPAPQPHAAHHPCRPRFRLGQQEGLRDSNPVGRGKYTPGRKFGGRERGLVPRLVKLPWIPDERQWAAVLRAVADETVRNRVMLALAYDAALRREELCLLGTEDVDPGRRTLRVEAENTKNRMERVVPYSAPTGVLLSSYLARRAKISRARGPVFLSESRRNYGQPVTLWTWLKVVRRIAVDSGVERFSTHTTRRTFA